MTQNKPYHLAEIHAELVAQTHRADTLYLTLKNSVALLKNKGVDVTEFTKVLKEYRK